MILRRTAPVSFSLLCLSLFGAALLAGCSASFVPDLTGSSTQTESGSGIAGQMHGGQQPVTGATVTVYATGATGYGSAATALAHTTTDSQGNFSFPSGAYTCSAGKPLYIVASGGNPGAAQGTNNQYIVQMAPLGLCDSIVSEVNIDEVSTVVFAYAMAQYGTSATNIGTSSTDTVGIKIAMANALNILNVAYGLVSGSTLAANSIGTVSANKIYYLADVLATCVNSPGSDNPGSFCYELFQYAGGTTSNDESRAIFYIAHNPTKNVKDIYNRVQDTYPFPKTLSEPIDWTLPITFSGVVGTPGNIAIDESGNAWVSDGSSSGGVAEISPVGVKTSFTQWKSSDSATTSSAMGSISQVAVNTDNTVWALDKSNNKIYRNDGTAWTPITGENLDAPVAISFSSSGSASVMNADDEYISQFSSSGIGQASPTYNKNGYDNGDLGTPKALATDSNGVTFVANYGGCPNCVGLLTTNNGSAYAYDDDSGTVDSGSAIVIDASGDPWQAQSSGIVELPTYASGNYQDYNVPGCLSIARLSGYYFNVTTGNFLGACEYAVPTTPTEIASGTGGLATPVALAIDGGGDLWAANSVLYTGIYGDSGTVSGFSGTTSLTGSTVGYTTGNSTATPVSVAADPAGNLWTVNSDGSVAEILGLAAPTKTPVYPTQIAEKP